MKILFYLIIISLSSLAGCTKSASNSSVSGSWRLEQKNWSFGPNSGVLKPAVDSTVLLKLNANKTYISKLNGATISQGTYSITTDMSNNHEPVLQLNNFKTTGIFSLFTIYEIGTNGQVVSQFDGLYININSNKMMLSGALTPGGSTSYTFVRN